VALNTDLFYKEIVGITSARFLNKEVGTKDKSVILKGFDLSGNGDRVLVKVETSGSIEGTFYLTCRPAFDPQKNLFSVEDVDFDMQSKSLLLKSADLFLHDTIRNMVQEKLNLDLTKQLAEAKQTASKAMAKVKLADKIFLAGNLKTLRVSDVMVQKDRISVQLYTEGDTALVFH
jgi:ABC-type polar amino acid transport system ATPase subunit